MAEEIQIPVVLYPQRTNNANASWDQLTQSTNAFQAAGWRMKDTEIAEVNGILARPIPSSINGTPAGKIRLWWITASATGSDVEWHVYLSDVTVDSDTCDPAAWDDSLTVVDTNNGAYELNQCDVSISSASLTSGKQVILNIKRDASAGNGDDTLAADVLLVAAVLIADE